jgi:radical SAM superfamily enzyme YgiQ (UPF0313 family)
MPARILFVERDISYEPQGIMVLSAVLKQAGHDVALTVASSEDPVAFALEYQPDILGFSVLTGSQQFFFDLNRRIRSALGPVRASAGRAPVFSAFGGPHPTFFPEMICEEGVDGICVGQGEGALLDLADAVGNGHGGAGSAFWSFLPTNIRNWWFNTDDGVVRNPVRMLNRDLSALPYPDRALVYDKHPVLANSKIKHFMTSRGCPYDCTYCFNHAFYKLYPGERRGHQLAVEDVIRQVNQVRSRWPLEQVVFVDDLFILRSDWLEEFADSWPRQVGLPFFCNVRADMLVKDPRRVELLKRAGCHSVSMGIEVANDRIRIELLKRRITRQQIVEAGRMVRASGMHIAATNILALPTSTLEDDLDTMRLNAEAHISYAHAFLFQPYPGTELGHFTEEHGLILGTFDDIGEVAWDHSILAFEKNDKRQREHLQRLFAIGVEWPWLGPIIRRLIRLPHNKAVDALFWWLQKLYRGFAIYSRVHPVKLGPRELVKTLMHYMWIRS